MKRIILITLLFMMSGCTTLSGKFEKVEADQLATQGLVVGQLSIYNQQNGKSFSDRFGPKFVTYATRSEPKKKVYELGVPYKDGRFAWFMEPGYYWFHNSQIRDSGNEIRFRDFDPITVKAGEILYIGDIHIDIGETHKVGIKEEWDQLKTDPAKTIFMGVGRPTDLTITVTDNFSDLQPYLDSLGISESKSVTKQITSSYGP